MTEKRRIYLRNFMREYRKTEKFKKYRYLYDRSDRRRAYWKEYCARPEVKKRRQINDAKIANKTRRRLYQSTPRGRICKLKWKNSFIGRSYYKAYKACWRQTVSGRASEKKQNAMRRAVAFQTIQLVYEANIKKYGRLTCYLCSIPIDFGKDHIEHKIPISRGGSNAFDNLAVACAKCNCRKHNKTVDEFLQCV